MTGLKNLKTTLTTKIKLELQFLDQMSSKLIQRGLEKLFNPHNGISFQYSGKIAVELTLAINKLELQFLLEQMTSKLIQKGLQRLFTPQQPLPLYR